MTELDAALGELGLPVRLLPPVVERTELNLAMIIDGLEAGIQSACWDLDEAVRRSAAAATREWARQEHGPLDAPLWREQTITWHAYDVPGAAG